MGIKLRCLSCGHGVDLAEAYSDYEGSLRCWACSGLMDVVLREGRLRSMRPSGSAGPAPDCGRALEAPGGER